MDEKIEQLKTVFDELFSLDICNKSYIEILSDKELILSANQEGFMCLIDEILKLCIEKKEYYHYHLDEVGMADKCEKDIIIKYMNSPWQS